MALSRPHVLSPLLLAFAIAHAVRAQAPTLPAPGQPTKSGVPGTFEIVGNSVVNAQQIFLGTPNKVYIVDKTENNPTQVNGHPAWAAEYTVDSNQGRPMDIITNSFCAGGNVLGNGTWINVGGNQAVTYGGLTAQSQNGGGPYDNRDGGQSMRLLDPCDDSTCNWADNPANDLTTRRWYPTVETLEDGSAIIIGGNQFGGFVNSAGNSNPTYEFFPSRGAPIGSHLLETTLPANLYPLTYLLPSGNLFIQLNWATAILDYKGNVESMLDNIPDAVRTYPASAGNAMLPLTPANNWTSTVLFCGGTNLESDQWVENWNLAAYPASSSCVKITPDMSGSYTHDDPIPEGRAMTSLLLLPDGKLLLVNGANTGTAGYGNTSWAIGQSYADHPVMTPVIYDPAAPAGKRWSKEGLSASTVPRMYHSSAVLLPDGSVFVTGSNPNADYTTNVPYPTEYRVERFYPSYYSKRRPQPQGLLASLTYGGPYFNVTLTKDDLFGDGNNAQTATVVLIRPGFSTHAMNMGQRMVQLDSSYTIGSDGGAVLHVSQLPPNPFILVPGPALLFVVVNGVPSVGVQVMVGSGKVETQTVLAAAPLPSSSAPQTPTADNKEPGASNKSGAEGLRVPLVRGLVLSLWLPAAAALFLFSR